MKYLILATLALVGGYTSLSAAKIELNFEGLESYSDFSIEGLSEEKTQGAFVDEVSRNLRLKKFVGEDRTLVITFKDIDMAGDIQPWRNRFNAEIRYIEGIYPPSMKFAYTLSDLNGAVIAQGEESIKDLTFDFNLKRPGNSQFEYELNLLEDWARKTLPRG